MKVSLKDVVQTILILAFVIFFLIVVIPSIQLIRSNTAEEGIGPQPLAPNLPAEVDESAVELYAQLVSAYEKSVDAYTALAKSAKPSKPERVYSLVVKDTIVNLLGKILAAFLAYAFVKGGAGIIDNAVRMKNNETPQPISLW